MIAKENGVIFKHIALNGKVTEADTLSALLNGAQKSQVPDLEAKLAELVCPDHETKLSALTIEQKKLTKQDLAVYKTMGVDPPEGDYIMLLSFEANCADGECCEPFEDMANDVLDQDQDRVMELLSSSEK